MVTIHQATPAEAGLIAEVGAQTFRQSHGHSGPVADIESYVAMTFTLNAVEEELNDPENIFHIIYLNGQAAGYAKTILNKPHPLLESSPVAKLERLYLLEEFYGLQLGAALFEFIIDLTKKAHQTGIWLFVWMKNQRAINFYKRVGLEIIGQGDFKISETHSNPNYIMYLKYRV